MLGLRALAYYFTVPKDRPELLVAQAEAFSRQVPLMYLVVLVNAGALAYTHLHLAPYWLTLGGMAVLGATSMLRMYRWWVLRDQKMDAARASTILNGTIRTAGILGIGFTGWALALYPYGEAYQKGHVAFFMSVTVIACIFCLMHLRAAALIVTICVLAPMTVFLLSTGEPVFQAIVLNVLVVAAAMVVVMLTHYREFADLIESRIALLQRAAHAQKLSDENHRLANLDSLTQLPNRRRFFAELESRLARARATGEGFVVGVVDLDGFKPVNDAFGHATGDRLLIEVGKRLASHAGAPIFAARLGGDEFGLIIDVADSAESVRALGAALCDNLRAPYNLPGVIAQIAGSIGFCPYPNGANTAQQLFERADYALYHAKQNLKGSAVVFDDRHEAAIRDLSRVEQALRRADLAGEMHIAFQPIVDIAVGRTVAFEALARWSSPELGEVAPNVFIRAAERSGQIVEVTQYLVAKALRAVHAWPMDIRVSINLSARDIASMEAVNRIVEIVRASHVAPHRIDFEITETAIVCDFDQARAALTAFHEIGVRTALDDFGTGHSSLSHVRLLPIDKLKIDASFVADIAWHQPSQDIVKTVLELCRNLRIDCVVEGVETYEQLTKVTGLGGTAIQGFYFSRPMPNADVPAYLAQESSKAFDRRARVQEDVRIGVAVATPTGPVNAIRR